MEIIYRLPSGEETSIFVDAVIRENPVSSAEVTTDPVEKGVAITDHVIPNPDTLALDCVVSNQPLETPRSHMQGITGTVRPLELAPHLGEANPRESGGLFGLIPAPPRASAANVLQFSGSFDRARAVYEEIRGLVRRGEVVRLVTGWKEYPSFVLRELSQAREASTGDSLVFTLNAVEIVIVETRIVQVPTAERRGQKKQSRGVQAPKPVEENTSMATKLKQKAQAFFGGD